MAISSRNDRTVPRNGVDEGGFPFAGVRGEVDRRGRPGQPQPRLKDRYTVGSVLGHGSLGATYRAYDHTMQRPVAIKLVSERYAHDALFGQRLLAATAAAGRLSHPHIVLVLDAGVFDGRPFVVMELVEGQSLRARLSNLGPSSLTVEECTRIAVEVADALEFAHSQRLVHGDLRPENVLLDRQARVKVADFGLVRAAVATDRTLLGSAMKRSPYVPAEQLLGAAADERTDVYALGALLYELLAGTPPNGMNVLSGAPRPGPLRAPRELRPDVPSRLDRAVMRALSADPVDRFASVEEFQRAITEPKTLVAPPSEHEVPSGWRADVRRRPPRGSRSVGHHVAALVPLAVSSAILLAAVLAFTVVLPRFFGAFQIIDIPTLLDHDVSEAESIASAHGLNVTVTGAQPTDDRPKDAVLTQSPPPGNRARRGSEIKLTLSAGMRPPNVVGKPVDEARAILTRAGWPVAGVDTSGDVTAPAGTVIGTRPGPDQTADDRKLGLTLLVSSGNVALGRPAVLSSGTRGPAEAFDGDLNTVGKLEGDPPWWVEVELARPTAVAALELVTAQEQPAAVAHEVWLWLTDGRFVGVHTFAGTTEDGQVLTHRFDQPIRDVRAVRIATIKAESQVAWREIRVLER